MADFVGTDLNETNPVSPSSGSLSGDDTISPHSGSADSIHGDAKAVGWSCGGTDAIASGGAAWWTSTIVRLIGRAMPRTAEALKPATAQSRLLLAIAADKAKRVFESHIDSFVACRDGRWERLDLGVRAGVEAQMMVVAESVTLLHLALRSLAYDEDRVERLNLFAGGNGFPKLKIRDDLVRLALREIWGRFSVPTRKKLDMRYLYFYRKRIASPTERSIFDWMTGYAAQTLTNEFVYGSPADTGWLQFVYDLTRGEIGAAREFLAQIRESES